MRTHISDTTCILALSGVKYISKDDIRFPSHSQFFLDCAYKGHTKRITYATKEERDTMFDKIVKHFEEGI